MCPSTQPFVDPILRAQVESLAMCHCGSTTPTKNELLSDGIRCDKITCVHGKLHVSTALLILVASKSVLVLYTYTLYIYIHIYTIYIIYIFTIYIYIYDIYIYIFTIYIYIHIRYIYTYIRYIYIRYIYIHVIYICKSLVISFLLKSPCFFWGAGGINHVTFPSRETPCFVRS